jgi:hypothetical protein
VRSASIRIGWLVCAGLATASLALLALNAQVIGNPGIVGGQALLILSMLLFATVGAAIRRHRPQNRMGWVYLGGATLGAIEFAAGQYALWGLHPGPSDLALARYAGWLVTWIQFPSIFCLLILTLFLFPTGAVASSRWRPPLMLAAAATAVVTIASALAPGSLPDPIQTWVNPVGLGGAPGTLFRAAADWALPVMAASLATAPSHSPFGTNNRMRSNDGRSSGSSTPYR